MCIRDRAKAFLDEAVPLASGSWADWQGGDPVLADSSQLVGRRPGGLLLRHNGLHIELVIDSKSPIGSGDPAGIADVVLEAALTTIIDLEDSVAAVSYTHLDVYKRQGRVRCCWHPLPFRCLTGRPRAA